MSVLPARASIEYICRLLSSYGVDIAAETFRQAKFDAQSAFQPLLQAVHDLAVCTAAGLPPGCGGSLRLFKRQLQQESLEGHLLPPEGVSLLLQLLLSWGCPTALVAQLSSSQQSSRACLLVLAWLISYAKLFDRALQHLQIPQQLLQLLPPYPQDTSITAAAQQQYTAATTAARQHANRVLQTLQATPTSGVGASCWQHVQGAAHHLQSTYRAASMRLQLLISLQEGREKLLHDIQQQQQTQPSVIKPGVSVKSAYPLSAFELHLISNPQLLSQHHEALQRGCSLLQQQLQCLQAAQTFFAWAESVVAEVRKPLTVNIDLQQRQRQQQQPAAVLTAPSTSDMQPLVQQLPAASSAVAPLVLQKVVRQLEQAAAQTGIDLQQSTLPSGSDPQGKQLLAQYQQAAAVAMVQAGVTCDVPQVLYEVPVDIQRLVDRVRDQQQQQQTGETAQSRQQSFWYRRHVDKEHMMLLTARTAQQQGGGVEDETDAALKGAFTALDINSTAAGLHGRSDGAAAGDTSLAVSMSAELQRLGAVATQVAKQLARTRAVNKEQLQVIEHIGNDTFVITAPIQPNIARVLSP